MRVEELINACDNALMAMGAERELLCIVERLPIYGYSLIGNQDSPIVYLSSGIHGDEPAGPLALLEFLSDQSLPQRSSWYVCPVLNPTGIKLGIRENFQGIDLNRDYLCPKSKEIAAHTAWLDGLQFDLAISLHEDWESTGFYYYEINQLKDQPQRYHKMREALSPIMKMDRNVLIDGHSVREMGWIYHDTDPDEPSHWPEAIFLAAKGCGLSFTLETPSSLDLKLRVRAHKAAVHSILENCMSALIK
jgi:hypothetical protein